MSNLDDILGVKAPSETSSPSTAAASSSSSSSSTQSQFIQTLFNQLVHSTKQSNALPDCDDYKYFTSTSPEFQKKSQQVQGQITNLLHLISSSITQKNEPALSASARKRPAPSSNLTSLDHFHTLSDTIDTALEAVDICLDEHRGVKRGNTSVGVATATVGNFSRGKNANNTQFNSTSTMAKPQLKFSELIDNSHRTWIPILPTKPNALKPLLNYEELRKEKEEKGGSGSGQVEEESSSTAAASSAAAASSSSTSLSTTTKKSDKSPKLSAAMTSHIASLGMSTELKSPVASLYPHPYKYEIENIDWNTLRAKHLVQVKEQIYLPLQQVTCTWIDSLETLKALVNELEHVTEIAIDLEHHSFRSYYGFTCLIQISTRTKDYLIDTLLLRKELWRLNTSFTNPSIMKVLHGADSDIIWLQRDFGLYIVNLFDTGQASRLLEFQSYGLAYLLKHYCDIYTDKKYQLADWRIRPLSAEMLLYARMDTHYLLYIYDRLKNELIQRSNQSQNQFSPIYNVPFLLATCIERSKMLTLKTYEKDGADINSITNGPLEFAFRMGVVIQNDVQSKILHALWKLRDDIARTEDESAFYICSNPNLMALIQKMPQDQMTLEAACNKPLPPLVRVYGQRVLTTIADAKMKASLTSPFLASTLPTMTGSPGLKGASGEAMEIGGVTQIPSASSSSSAMQTPQKQHRNLFTGAAALTPSSHASALFAQLSTSTPQHSHHNSRDGNSGWVSSFQESGSSLSQSSGAQSPVMTTEQLYSSANWIAASKNLEKSLATVKNPHPQHGSAGGIAIPLFDESGDFHSIPKSSSYHAQMSPAPKTPFSLLASPMSTFGSGGAAYEENRVAMLQAQLAITSAPTFAQTIASMSTPIKSHTQQQHVALTSMASADAPHMMDLDDDAAMTLRTPNTGEPQHSFVSPSPMSLHVIPSPPTLPQTFTSIAGDAPKTTSSSSDAPVGDSPLPKSMRDIYKMSNENRRKKKKMKTGSTGAAGPINSGMDDDEQGGGATNEGSGSRPQSAGLKKGHASGNNSMDLTNDAPQHSSMTSSTEFMRNIGWNVGTPPVSAGNNNVAGGGQQQQQQPNSANSYPDHKRKHGNSAPSSGAASLSSSPPSTSPAFHAFDYTHATLPPSNPSQQAYFSPYSDMGRDKLELKSLAGTSGPVNPQNKIYKGHNQLKNSGKSVTVRMGDDYQRQRGSSAGSNNNNGIPIPAARNPSQQQRR